MGCYHHKTQTGAVTGILGTLPNSDAVYLSRSRHWGLFSPVPLRSTVNELGAFHGYGHESTAWYRLMLLPRWCCSLFSWQEQARFHCRQQKSLSWPLMRAELGLFFFTQLHDLVWVRILHLLLRVFSHCWLFQYWCQLFSSCWKKKPYSEDPGSAIVEVSWL